VWRYTSLHQCIIQPSGLTKHRYNFTKHRYNFTKHRYNFTKHRYNFTKHRYNFTNTGITSLNTGITSLSTGITSLSTGMTSLSTGITSLSTGITSHFRMINVGWQLMWKVRVIFGIRSSLLIFKRAVYNFAQIFINKFNFLFIVSDPPISLIKRFLNYRSI